MSSIELDKGTKIAVDRPTRMTLGVGQDAGMVGPVVSGPASVFCWPAASTVTSGGYWIAWRRRAGRGGLSGGVVIAPDRFAWDHIGGAASADDDAVEITPDALARMVAAYVEASPGSDAYDISEALKLPMDLVEEAAEELVRRGKLNKGDSTAGE